MYQGGVLGGARRRCGRASHSLTPPYLPRGAGAHAAEEREEGGDREAAREEDDRVDDPDLRAVRVEQLELGAVDDEHAQLHMHVHVYMHMLMHIVCMCTMQHAQVHTYMYV